MSIGIFLCASGRVGWPLRKRSAGGAGDGEHRDGEIGGRLGRRREATTGATAGATGPLSEGRRGRRASGRAEEAGPPRLLRPPRRRPPLRPLRRSPGLRGLRGLRTGARGGAGGGPVRRERSRGVPEVRAGGAEGAGARAGAPHRL